MNGYRVRDHVSGSQFVGEDVGIPPCYSSKKRRTGASDPRFKRVIHSEVRGDACAEMEANKLSTLQQFSYAMEDSMNDDRILREKVISYLKTPNETSLSNTFRKLGDQKEICQQGVSEMVTKDVGFKASPRNRMGCDPTLEPFPEPEKIINSKTNLKRSASDCTLNTKNKLAGENEEEVCRRVRPYPSATKINRVQNWIKEYKVVPEKRRSVITVIGQTQTKPFSKVLNEINQRRKLAKELDKHALCEAIMESAENQTEVKNLVAKVDFVLPDGKVIYSAEKVYLCKENGKYGVEKDVEEFSALSKETAEGNDQQRKRCEMIPERDSSISQVGRRSRTKRSSKRIGVPADGKIHLKDRIRTFFKRISWKLFWSLLLVVCLALAAYACVYTVRPPDSYFLSELFKPKTVAWYEKLLF